MTQEIRSLIRSRVVGKISTQQFLSAYFKGHAPNKEYCVELLNKGLNNRDGEIIQEALIVISAAEFNDNAFSGLL